MAGERRRRLAAILAADMVGYSRLASADGEGTLARLRVLPEGEHAGSRAPLAGPPWP